MNKKLILVGLLAMSSTIIVGCKKKNQDAYNNEVDPLIFSSQELDKVFNPFFSTSAADSNVIGLTQLGMLGNDKNGNPTYGDNEDVICKDLEITTTGEGEAQTTEYKFVVKNDIKFSNGSPLTIKDILFNYYVYLDPAYTGSSTIYSTDIVGLKEYRTQESDEKEQDSFAEKFKIEAETRISALSEASDNIVDDHGTSLTVNQFKSYLASEYATDENYAHVVEDFEKACVLFKEELESDYSNSMDSYSDMKFFNKAGQEFKNMFTTDVEVFLYNEGYISWNKKDGKMTCSFKNDYKEVRTMTKEQAIETVYEDKIPTSTSEVILYWATSSNLFSYIQNLAMAEYFKNQTLKFPNISGIKFANQKTSVNVNGTTYGTPTYKEDGSVANGNEVLSITIHKVDPKAIWNFSLAIAPMYYYSDDAHINAFDIDNNKFGVEYADPDFMSNVVKRTDRIGVPMGAGAYAASCSTGGITNIASGDFYDKGMIYYERNPYYNMGPNKGPATIKKIRYKVVPSNQMINSLTIHDVDFVEPNSKPETIATLDTKKSEGISYKEITTSGYGYIGINAGKVPSIKIRQAIMHSIRTQSTADYYGSHAKAIHRSMSTASWAYPTGCTAYYPYVGDPIPENLDVVNPDYKDFVLTKGLSAGETMSLALQKEFLVGLVEDAGYTLGGDDVYTDGKNILRYTFTVAGEETDHPAWAALEDSSTLLNSIGFEVNVTTDAQALKKLSDGSLTVWAAAWGSTIDPDMYQVYHKESTATSTLNWGYKQIKQNAGGKYDTELAIVDELSELIEEGRETNDQAARKRTYSAALDLVMELAVELPTYQRSDLFAYNSAKIDVNTLTKDSDLSPFKGLTSDLAAISLVTKVA